MSEWKAKRFWTEVSVVEEERGFAILLDGRPVRTPAKTQVIVPTDALAQEIAQEWEAQEGEIDPRAMLFTRTANAALDKVTAQREEVIEMLAEYGASDLTCYRASDPEGLVARQAEAWDPLIEWAADTFDARLKPTTGVMYAAQDQTALERLKAPIDRMSVFEIAAFHDLVSLSGSLLIALATTRNYAPLDDLWARSRVDETWQEEQWGEDEEASALAAHKRSEFMHAGRVWHTLSLKKG
ncbi:ATP12 family chaperone protein [Primorskyibacter sp. S187A]|uniref:ATP12 family chaperone protein n=1 Tax=Primorskyibacter sp. S187A TaxID=3415130 RepID=UPI003C7E03E4